MVNIKKKLKNLLVTKPSWGESSQGVQSRQYQSYEQYLEHQKSKLNYIKSISKKSQVLIEALSERLPLVDAVRAGASALCLGARSGAECEAFREMGVFAVGIDLNPGKENKYVLPGDFHAIQFADSSVDIIYTNSLDHSFDLARVVGEVARVLKPGGTFIAEIVLGVEDTGGREAGDFEASWWAKADDVITRIEAAGLKLEGKSGFTLPWKGVQAIFAKPAGQ